MRSKFLLASALVLLLAAAFAAVGYAYTASTENSGNMASSEYVVLTQQEYTFTNDNLKFDVVDTDGGKVYQLLGGYTQLIAIDGKTYYGVEVGHDKLKATVVGGTSESVKVEVSSPGLIDGWFTDYSNELYDWRYILEVKDSEDNEQYVYYDGALGSEWKYITGDSLVLTPDEEYTTTLYFAGVGINTAAALRSANSLLKVSSDISISAVWKPVSDPSNGLIKCVFKSNTEAGGSGADRVLYLEEGYDLILPENMFTHTSKEFVGWLDNGEYGTGLVLSPSYTFKTNNKEHEFVAQWEEIGNVKTITFNGNVATGTMASQYVKSGNSFTLPLCEFTKAGNMFTKWVVTATDGSPEADYSGYDKPYMTIQDLRESITITANWAESSLKNVKILDQEGNVKYVLGPERDDLFTIPYCIFGPPSMLVKQGFEGWEFEGWSVWKKTPRTVAQSYTMPIGNDGYIIKNGMIRFAYDNGLENGQV